MKENYEKQLRSVKEFLNDMPWEDKNFYVNYLSQTYYFVCHSTRLLSRSISHFNVDRDHLYKRFVSHLKEENYHERIALNDLKNLGVDVNDCPEFELTKAFWECQYHKIDASKGISLLGYILFLEAIAVFCFDDVSARLQKSYGKNAMNFIHVHTNEDPHHLEEAINQIEMLSDEEKQLVWSNFYQTSKMYIGILNEAKHHTLATFSAA